MESLGCSSAPGTEAATVRACSWTAGPKRTRVWLTVPGSLPTVPTPKPWARIRSATWPARPVVPVPLRTSTVMESGAAGSGSDPAGGSGRPRPRRPPPGGPRRRGAPPPPPPRARGHPPPRPRQGAGAPDALGQLRAVDHGVEEAGGADAVEQHVRLIGARRYVPDLRDRQPRALHRAIGEIAQGSGQAAEVAECRLLVDGERVGRPRQETGERDRVDQGAARHRAAQGRHEQQLGPLGHGGP